MMMHGELRWIDVGATVHFIKIIIRLKLKQTFYFKGCWDGGWLERKKTNKRTDKEKKRDKDIQDMRVGINTSQKSYNVSCGGKALSKMTWTLLSHV